jgi:hypothetical protein
MVVVLGLLVMTSARCRTPPPNSGCIGLVVICVNRVPAPVTELRRRQVLQQLLASGISL